MRYGEENSGVPFRVTTPGTTTQDLAPLLHAKSLKALDSPQGPGPFNSLSCRLALPNQTRPLFSVTRTRRERQQKQPLYAQGPSLRPLVITGHIPVQRASHAPSSPCVLADALLGTNLGGPV